MGMFHINQGISDKASSRNIDVVWSGLVHYYR